MAVVLPFQISLFVLFQLSTTWLNSTVKGSAPRLLTMDVLGTNGGLPWESVFVAWWCAFDKQWCWAGLMVLPH